MSSFADPAVERDLGRKKQRFLVIVTLYQICRLCQLICLKLHVLLEEKVIKLISLVLAL